MTRTGAAFLCIGDGVRNVTRTLVTPDGRLEDSHAAAIARALEGLSGRPAAISALTSTVGLVEGIAGSLMAVPLQVGVDQRIGLLAVYDSSTHPGRRQDQESLRLIADGLLSELKLQVVSSRRRQRAAHLSSQRGVLRRIAAGAPLSHFIRALAAHVEQQSAGALCVISMTTSRGVVRQVASQAMPDSFLEVLKSGAQMGTGRAAKTASLNEPFFIHDFTADPENAFARAALEHGFVTCWSVPVQVEHSPAARIDVYRLNAGDPERSDLNLLSVSAAMARIALERTATESRLRRSEDYYRSLIEKSSDLILVLDRHGRAKYVSPPVTRIFGLEAGRTLDPLLTAGNDTYWREQLDSLKAGQENSFDIELRSQDGTSRKLEVVGTNLLNTPSVRGIVINARDVTDRKAIEEKLRQSQRLEAIGQLAGGVAHDFNNILTAISGFATLLQEDPENADLTGEALSEIRRASDRGASLTRQLLAFSRRQVLQPRWIDPNTVVDGIGAMLRRLIGENIEIERRLSDAGSTVYMDPGQLEQVLINLAVNARDSMPQGGLLTIETAICEELPAGLPRTLTQPGERYLRLTVEDTGFGMDELTLSRAFEPFFTTKPLGTGTGLGLATVYGIAEQSGGHVRLHSRVGFGTRVELFFPAVAAARPQQVAEPVEKRWTRGSESILIVEDDPTLRSLVPKLLVPAGYEVRVAEDGPTALRMLESSDYRPDLLLTDVVLPGMSGRIVADQMRLLAPDLDVVFMSGYTAAELGQYGVLDQDLIFVQKPFTRAHLLDVLRHTLDQRANRQKPDPAAGPVETRAA
ncbi:MAG: ATP-binding protein [Gemmatimonadota bacterium]